MQRWGSLNPLVPGSQLDRYRSVRQHGQGSVGRQFSKPEIVDLTVVAVAAINDRDCLASGFR
jgi:hypothetical protein